MSGPGVEEVFLAIERKLVASKMAELDREKRNRGVDRSQTVRIRDNDDYRFEKTKQWCC
jgi:hypothetical protein